jgi:hypothetical protein
MNPTFRIHTQWQVAQSRRTSQNLPKSMVAHTHGRKKARLPNRGRRPLQMLS